MKTFFGTMLIAAVLGFFCGTAHFDPVSSAEAAPKYTAQMTGPSDGGSSNPVCFGIDSTHSQKGQRVITFETHQSLSGTTVAPSFCLHTCQSNGGTSAAPTATLASCAANCTQDYVPLLSPLGINPQDAGAREPIRYTTVQFDMASDNCVSVAPVDPTLPLDGGVILYEVTGNYAPRSGRTY